MRTLSLTKVNIMRRTLFVMVLLLAFAMVFAVTAKPSHAATLDGEYTLNENYSPGINTIPTLKATTFELYKVGSFVVGDPYVKLDEPYDKMGVLPLKADPDKIGEVKWTKEWLSCAATIDNGIKSMQNAPTPITVNVDTNGEFSVSGLANGLYLLRGDSQIVENYPAAGQSSYWWPQPMLVSILNSDVTVGVKPMTGTIHHLKVQKKWQWPSDVDANIKELAGLDAIDVELYYNGVLQNTVTLNDANNWTYEWDTGKDEDPSLWSVQEVVKGAGQEEFEKSFTVTYEPPKFYQDDNAVVTITNTYDRRTLQITKTLDAYIDNGEGNSTSLVFELSGYKGDKRIYHKYVGMQFDGKTDSQTLSVKDIPLGLDRLMVKEVYSSNYEPDATEKEANGPDEKGVYTVSFKNSPNGKTHGSGVINKFKINAKAYKFDKSQGTGN